MNEQSREGSIYSVDVNDVNGFNDLEMSMLLVEMFKNKTSIDFERVFKSLAKKYEKEKGVKPSIDLIFHSDDLGSDKETQVARLRFLKAIGDNFKIREYVKDIIVKSPDANFKQVEPNVFASDIKFEIIK